MIDFQSILSELNKHLAILREREAKYVTNSPLELCSQIKDHEDAITLTRKVRDGEIDETEWREAMQTLLISDHIRPSLGELNSHPDPPFMVDSLSADFVPRLEEMEPLIEYLLNNNKEEEENNDPIITALFGAGGYGKTTLARAICHDERIRNTFSDGILWVTLGENPNVVTAVTKIYAQLTNQRPVFHDQEDAANSLSRELAKKRCLLVVDDIWNQAHLGPFLRGGPECACLITTRDRNISPRNTHETNVDAMQQSEAIALLEAGLDHTTDENLSVLNHTSQLSQLAGRLGEWPLLLKLVNGALRDHLRHGQILSHALNHVNKILDKQGLTAFDTHNASERKQAVSKTLSVSFDLLAEDELARYRELVVFPEDIDVPLVTLQKLWGRMGKLDKHDVEELCVRLAQISLLVDLNLAAGTIRLHDVIRTYLIHQFTPTELHNLHALLLNTHRPTKPSALLPDLSSVTHNCFSWADLSDNEPYLWPHLAYHLLASDQGNELVETVKGLRYLVIKAHLYNTFAAELDLNAAINHALDDALDLLYRHFIQMTHLFIFCDHLKEKAVLLYSRLYHLSILSDYAQRLQQTLPSDVLIATFPLPELPHHALQRSLINPANVLDCAFSPDGKSIICTLTDRSLAIWNAKNGQYFGTITGIGWSYCCCYSPDGQMLVTASHFNSGPKIKLFDAKTGYLIANLIGHTDTINSCAFSPDGDFLISASDDKTIRLWDIKNRLEMQTFYNYTDRVTSCDFSPDGSRIISASQDDTLKLWDMDVGLPTKTFTRHRPEVCTFSPDGRLVASSSEDGTLEIRDIDTGGKTHTIQVREFYVDDCAFSPDGKMIIATAGSLLKVWDVSTGLLLDTLHGHAGGIRTCAFSPDGQLVVSGGWDKTLRIWETKNLADGSKRSGFTTPLYNCSFNPTGQLIALTSRGNILIWDLDSQDVKGEFPGEGCSAFSPDGRLLISASEKYAINMWDIQSGQKVLTLTGHTDWVTSCDFSPDGHLVASSSEDKTLKIWDVQSGRELYTLAGHSERVTHCDFSPNGRLIVSASSDGFLRLWEVETGHLIRAILVEPHGVKSCAFNPNGNLIVSGSSWDIRVWKVESGDKFRVLAQYKDGDQIERCVFSPDGRFVVAATKNNALKVWAISPENDIPVAHGDCLTTFPLEGDLQDCDWSPDGQHIVAVGPMGLYLFRFIQGNELESRG